MEDIKKQLVVCDGARDYRGVYLPQGVRYRQLFVTGPPGSGKSTFVSRLRGWPLEGYLDLSRRWWQNPALTFRPREIHLGIPFFDYKEAFTVFDPEWLSDYSTLEIDRSRIRIPPNHAGLTSKNQRRKFVFEFLIPPPDKAFHWRSERARSGLFPFEQNLTPEIVHAQSAVYMEMAAYLHQLGVPVYVREGFDARPMQFNTPVTAPLERDPLQAIPGVLVRRLHSLTIGARIKPLVPSDMPQTIGNVAKILNKTGPFCMTVRKTNLLIMPDTAMNGDTKGRPRDWLLVNLNRFLDGQGGIIHLKENSGFTLGKSVALLQTLGLPRKLMNESIRINNQKGTLFIDRNRSSVKIAVRTLIEENSVQLFNRKRAECLQWCSDMFGGIIEPLDPHHALKALQKTNHILAADAYRPINQWGDPGAILELPETMTPIIIGDLHGQVDNLLKVLSYPEIMSGLESSKYCLVLLGDMIHSDEDRQLEEMDSSILMLDMVVRLKNRFPENMFMLRGNHESFSPEVAKGNVNQGQVFEKYLIETRGQEYRDAVDRFFQLLPYIVKAPTFIASHAAPTRGLVSFDTLVDLAKLKGYAHEVTHNRVIRPGFSMGYSKGDIKKFRRALGVRKGTPFLVGHTRPSEDGGVWENFAHIKNYTIIYSSGANRFGFMIAGQGGMLPFEPAREPLVEVANQQFQAAAEAGFSSKAAQ